MATPLTNDGANKENLPTPGAKQMRVVDREQIKASLMKQIDDNFTSTTKVHLNRLVMQLTSLQEMATNKKVASGGSVGAEATTEISATSQAEIEELQQQIMDLQREKSEWQAERDGLLATQAALTTAREELLATQATLTAELAESLNCWEAERRTLNETTQCVVQEKDALEKERSTLSATWEEERSTWEKERAHFQTEMGELQGMVATLQADVEKAKRELAAAAAAAPVSVPAVAPVVTIPATGVVESQEVSAIHMEEEERVEEKESCELGGREMNDDDVVPMSQTQESTPSGAEGAMSHNPTPDFDPATLEEQQQPASPVVQVQVQAQAGESDGHEDSVATKIAKSMPESEPPMPMPVAAAAVEEPAAPQASQIFHQKTSPVVAAAAVPVPEPVVELQNSAVRNKSVFAGEIAKQLLGVKRQASGSNKSNPNKRRKAESSSPNDSCSRPEQKEAAAMPQRSRPKAVTESIKNIESIKEVRGMRKALEDIKDGDWNVRMKHMARISELIKKERLCETVGFYKMWVDMLPTMGLQVTDLRSSIVKEAVKLIVELCDHIDFTDSAAFLLPLLFKGLYVTIKVISGSVDQCLRVLIAKCAHPKIFAVLLTGIDDNHSILRSRCLEYMGIFLKNAKAQHTEAGLGSFHCSLANAIKNMMNDADPDCRVNSRNLFIIVDSIWPDLGAKLFSEFSGTVQRRIQKQKNKASKSKK